MSVPKRFKTKKQIIFQKKNSRIFTKRNEIPLLSKYSNFLSIKKILL
jgi:hypothetical protein